MFIFLDKKRDKFSQWLKRKTTMDFSDWSVFVLFILGFFTVYYLGKDGNLVNQTSNIVLWLTAIAILQYTKETYWLKEISRKQLGHQRESNLRPIILRSGYISKWENVRSSLKNGQSEGERLQFAILKNIAKDINGYIVLDGKKYQLYFANEITRTNKDNIEEFHFLSEWGWMRADTIIYATYFDSKFENVKEENSISLFYKDIENHKYYTRENQLFSQSSGKL